MQAAQTTISAGTGTSNVLGNVLKKKTIVSNFVSKATSTFLFCSDCLHLIPCRVDATPHNLLMNYFCPSCQDVASTEVSRCLVTVEDLKKKRETTKEQEQLEQAIKEIEKKSTDWIETQKLTGTARLFSKQDVDTVLLEIQYRSLVLLGWKDPEGMLLYKKLFNELYFERVTLNNNLEENLANKTF